MRYKVFVSSDTTHEAFYCEKREQATLLFNMAVDSQMFTHIKMSECFDDDYVKMEWEALEEVKA